MADSTTNPPPKSFEAALAELESIVQGMEAGKLPLEESITAYQRGMELLKFCQATLDAADQKIQVLEGGRHSEFREEGGAAGEDAR